MHASLDYQVFLTRNSEYHLQCHVCIGVRDRRTGAWVDTHPALHRALTSTVRTAGELAVLQRPQLGESLEFDLDGAPLRTSPVLNIEQRRPARPESEPTGVFAKPTASLPRQASTPPEPSAVRAAVGAEAVSANSLAGSRVRLSARFSAGLSSRFSSGFSARLSARFSPTGSAKRQKAGLAR